MPFAFPFPFPLPCPGPVLTGVEVGVGVTGATVGVMTEDDGLGDGTAVGDVVPFGVCFAPGVVLFLAWPGGIAAGRAPVLGLAGQPGIVGTRHANVIGARPPVANRDGTTAG
ncbi:MAG: hypothetical protein ACRDJU_06365 [Actinomycetota bacterium]